MTWFETSDVEQYLAATGDLLFPDPARHTVALTVAENARNRADGTRFAWWDEGGGDITGAVSLTPPYPLLLAVVPDHAVRPLVALLRPEAVAGPTALGAHVAAISAAGRPVLLKTAERLHRLTELVHPDVAGAARAATLDDLDVLSTWFRAFVAEASVIDAGTDAEVFVRERLSWNGFVLWEQDGRPVAMAGRTRTAFGMVRLGPVYTPPGHRGRGYGGAVTAAMCQLAQDQGAGEVVLFTDLTNPTSNALYARLGFVPLSDRAVFSISSP